MKTKRVKFLRSKEWQQLRQQALERDQHRCFLCGATEKLVCHHIRYRRFKKALEACLDNLITCCQSCHFKIHKSSANIELIEKLRTERPEQFQFIIQNP